MIIAGQDLSQGPPAIVAEISCNHEGSLDKAKTLIEAAKEAGADFCKFQAYDPESMTIDSPQSDFTIHDGPWKGRTLHDLYKEAQTPLDWMPELFGHAERVGIIAFSSVFCARGLEVLERCCCPAYKIASFEITDIPLIEKVAETGKPIILSTGMASDGEIEDAWRAAWKNGNDVAVLHCTSSYPCPPQESNLARMRELALWYDTVGISDHTIGMTIPVAATVFETRLIEKHLTHGGQSGSPDALFSMNPTEFKAMVVAVRDAWMALQPVPEAHSEDSSRQLRRSLYAVHDIQQGEMFTVANVRSIRPGYGLPPRMLPEILGKRAKVAMRRGTALKEVMIDEVDN